MSITNYLAATIFTVCLFPSLAADAGEFTTLYSFKGGANGGNPSGSLTYHGGELYGTLPAYDANLSYMGGVYKVHASNGAYKAIYAFQGGTDGRGPANGVIYSNGMLYGTTWFGGGGCPSQGCGTIFSIDAKSGVEHALFNFSPGPNNTPVGAGALISLAGTLYSTTEIGGTSGKGSIFAFNPTTDSFLTLYNFTGGLDGNQPNPTLLYQNGLFYGTTQFGGTACTHSSPGGCGTIFTIDPTTGDEAVLHAFKSGVDGKYPYSNLIYRAGRLTGDTNLGGDRQSCRRGCGVSFFVKTRNGNETVINTFATLGESYSGLALVHGVAYEALPYGGSGYGELVQLDLKSGQQTVLYTFSGGADGSFPQAALTYHDGALFGTTTSGGNVGCAQQNGCGTVFEFVP